MPILHSFADALRFGGLCLPRFVRRVFVSVCLRMLCVQFVWDRMCLSRFVYVLRMFAHVSVHIYAIYLHDWCCVWFGLVYVVSVVCVVCVVCEDCVVHIVFECSRICVVLLFVLSARVLFLFCFALVLRIVANQCVFLTMLECLCFLLCFFVVF